MIQDEKNKHHFTADDGKTFVHKTTNVRYGNDIYLAADDVIDNYQEEPLTQEEIDQISSKKQIENERKNTHKRR